MLPRFHEQCTYSCKLLYTDPSNDQDERIFFLPKFLVSGRNFAEGDFGALNCHPDVCTVFGNEIACLVNETRGRFPEIQPAGRRPCSGRHGTGRI